VEWQKWPRQVKKTEMTLTQLHNEEEALCTASDIINAGESRYWEILLVASENGGEFNGMSVGAVRPGAYHDEYSGLEEFVDGDHYLVGLGNQRIWGHGRGYPNNHCPFKNRLTVGDRIGVLVDLCNETKSVRFFINGDEYGSAFTSGVRGPLVLGVRLFNAGQCVQLLPGAQSPAKIGK
jgi:hypothetical protein